MDYKEHTSFEQCEMLETSTVSNLYNYVTNSACYNPLMPLTKGVFVYCTASWPVMTTTYQKNNLPPM